MVEEIACCQKGITNAQRVPLLAARETPRRSRCTIYRIRCNCTRHDPDGQLG